MALTNAYLVTTKNLEAFLNAVQSAKAPERFSAKFLTQLDFTSSNDRLYIGLFKALGLTDESGVQTKRYYAFLDQGESAKVLAEAIREAYEDLFAVNKKANELSVEEIKNKLKTLTQGQKSENIIGLMASTFKSLCGLADWKNLIVEKEKRRNKNKYLLRLKFTTRRAKQQSKIAKRESLCLCTTTYTCICQSLVIRPYSTLFLMR